MEVGSSGMMPACLLVDRITHFMFNRVSHVNIRIHCSLANLKNKVLFINQYMCYNVLAS